MDFCLFQTELARFQEQSYQGLIFRYLNQYRVTKEIESGVPHMDPVSCCIADKSSRQRGSHAVMGKVFCGSLQYISVGTPDQFSQLRVRVSRFRIETTEHLNCNFGRTLSRGMAAHSVCDGHETRTICKLSDKNTILIGFSNHSGMSSRSNLHMSHLLLEYRGMFSTVDPQVPEFII